MTAHTQLFVHRHAQAGLCSSPSSPSPCSSWQNSLFLFSVPVAHLECPHQSPAPQVPPKPLPLKAQGKRHGSRAALLLTLPSAAWSPHVRHPGLALGALCQALCEHLRLTSRPPPPHSRGAQAAGWPWNPFCRHTWVLSCLMMLLLKNAQETGRLPVPAGRRCGLCSGSEQWFVRLLSIFRL